MHGHRAALRRNLVEIEATPGFVDSAGGAATRAAELGTRRPKMFALGKLEIFTELC